MAALRGAEAHEVFASQRLNVEARQHLTLEAVAHLVPVSVAADLERVAPRRTAADVDGAEGSGGVGGVPATQRGVCAIHRLVG